MKKVIFNPTNYNKAVKIKQILQSDKVLQHEPISELNNFAKKKYSHYGEEGMIVEMASRIGIDKGWFVELGAGNGIYLCNTRILAEEGWKGLYIEPNKKLFSQLEYSTSKFPNIKTHKCHVNCEPDTKLDDIMDKYEVPMNFDVLSLDIDGNDYWVWDSLIRTPKIALIEYNGNYPNEASKTIKYDPQLRGPLRIDRAGDDYYGATARAMFKLGTKKGYKLVAQLGPNMFFVHNKYAKLFTEFPIDQILKNPKLEQSSPKNMIDV